MSTSQSLDEQVAHLTRGALDVIDRTELRAKLARGTPLIVKLGADPTAPDLHLGHAVVLHAMRRYQDLGHRVQFLIGDQDIANNAVTVDGVRVTDAAATLAPGVHVLRHGRNRFARVIVRDA